MKKTIPILLIFGICAAAYAFIQHPGSLQPLRSEAHGQVSAGSSRLLDPEANRLAGLYPLRALGELKLLDYRRLPEAYQKLGFLEKWSRFYLNEKDVPSAMDFLKKLTEIDLQGAEAWDHLGDIAASREDWLEALRLYTKARDKDPGHDEALFGMAVASLAVGRADQAWILFEEYVERNPDSHRAYHNLGMIFLKKGWYKDASDAIQQALVLSPENDELRIVLADTFAHRGLFEEAIEVLLEIRSGYAVVRFEKASRLGVLYARTGRSYKALESFQKALEIKPRDDRVIADLGALYLQQGEKEAGVELLEKALSINPANTLARQYLQQMEDAEREQRARRQAAEWAAVSGSDSEDAPPRRNIESYYEELAY